MNLGWEDAVTQKRFWKEDRIFLLLLISLTISLWRPRFPSGIIFHLLKCHPLTQLLPFLPLPFVTGSFLWPRLVLNSWAQATILPQPLEQLASQMCAIMSSSYLELFFHYFFIYFYLSYLWGHILSCLTVISLWIVFIDCFSLLSNLQ